MHACAPPLTQEWRKASLTDEFMGFSRGLARTSLEAVVVDQFDNEQKLMSVLRKQLSASELEGLRELLAGNPMPYVPIIAPRAPGHPINPSLERDQINEPYQRFHTYLSWVFLLASTRSTLLPDAMRAAHKTVFVLEFSGDTQASGVKALSAEITALLQLNQLPDEVIIKIQSPGGTVTGYGLASAELKVIVSLHPHPHAQPPQPLPLACFEPVPAYSIQGKVGLS